MGNVYSEGAPYIYMSVPGCMSDGEQNRVKQIICIWVLTNTSKHFKIPGLGSVYTHPLAHTSNWQLPCDYPQHVTIINKEYKK